MNKIIVGVLVVAAIAGIYVYQNLKKADTDKQPENQTQENMNNAEQNTQDSGLKVEVLQEGAGQAAKNNDTVAVHYTGWLENGTKFDSSVDRGQPFSFRLGIGQVIKGWDQGVLGMKVGEKRKLTIPSSLGYGSTGTPGGPIPPNATLIFEVELLGIGQ